jgi:glycosyltransferase involved in cell wall biosynthesis
VTREIRVRRRSAAARPDRRAEGSASEARRRVTRTRALPGRRILLLEPFDGGSHRAFARGWAARSRHHVGVEALPARAWKWRLRGAAWTFAERPLVRAALRPGKTDAVVATSLMNAADFRAAARLAVPLIVYLHENQLRYPRPPDEPLDHGLALASLASAAAADALVFNSRFHRRDFFEGLADWVRRFPEHAPRRTVAALRRRACVIPPGIEWDALSSPAGRKSAGPPVILWNHRWEFDKNPGAFFSALGALANRGLKFQLVLLGENSQFVPKPFLAARERFGPGILRYGYAPSRRDYLRWLGRSDIVVSTARQENFGISVVEAIAAGAFPVLPARLSYPEILPAAADHACFYRTQVELVSRLGGLLARPETIASGRARRARAMRRYDWSIIAPRLDALVDEIVDRT